ncbi:pupal cuticle protein G1A [Drosophila innubila]|uniref:pupal cuticle protein G1A n=1 Tax=Drosophila innubila TaxID=198719 RepID=UPI00148BDE7B|nr:pupal cuticle protein G1A [Drosophila innubila]
MFKLFVLAAFVAVAAARPGHLAAAPLVYSAPTAYVQESTLAKVGAVVKSVPTAVSHQSVTQVHSTPVVEDVVAPVVKTTLHAAAPVATYAAHAPVVSTYSAVAPAAYTTYAAAHAPVAYSAPLGYSAPVLHHAPLTYAASAW